MTGPIVGTIVSGLFGLVAAYFAYKSSSKGSEATKETTRLDITQKAQETFIKTLQTRVVELEERVDSLETEVEDWKGRFRAKDDELFHKAVELREALDRIARMEAK